MITDQLWNVDIWFFDKENIEAATDYCDSIVQQTTPEQFMNQYQRDDK